MPTSGWSPARRRLIGRADVAAMTPTSWTCREWEALPIGDGGVPENEAGRLLALAERAARRLKLPSPETVVLARIHRGLRAGQVVGILVTPRSSLEILPKIDGNVGAVRAALVHMLAVVWELPVADGELAALDTQRDDLLEILVGLFAGRLLAAVRRGLLHRYVAHEEDLKWLRGRLDVTRQVTHLAVRPDRLACRFDELSPDTPLNRILKAAVSRLDRLTRSPANARRLAELAARFEAVSDSADPLREPVRLDRTNTAFHDLHRLARLFLAGDWQSTAGGHAAGFALLFPMNDLFEAFIGKSLQRAFASRRTVTVRLQDCRHHALSEKKIDRKDTPLFALKPDAVIEIPPDRPIVLDTKWKRLASHKTTLGVEGSDVYQMLAYGRAYGATRLVLLYPWDRKTGEAEGVIRRWTVAAADGQTDINCYLDVATIDVSRPDRGRVAAILRATVGSSDADQDLSRAA